MNLYAFPKVILRYKNEQQTQGPIKVSHSLLIAVPGSVMFHNDVLLNHYSADA